MPQNEELTIKECSEPTMSLVVAETATKTTLRIEGVGVQAMPTDGYIAQTYTQTSGLNERSLINA